IGLDGIPLATPRTGIGHYSYELARSLALVAPAHEFQLVSPSPFAALSREEIASLPTNLRVVCREARGLKRRWWTIGSPLYVDRFALDLFHGTNYCVPLWNRCRTVVTIHDLTLFLYPETFQQHVLRRARRRLPIMARAATMIVTPSESVRREVCEHLGVEAQKVVAVPEAARRVFRPVNFEQTLEARRRLGVEEDFVLFVGTIEPRKNLLTLVRAFEDVLREMRTRPPQLVIVGKVGWQSDDLYSYIDKSGMSARVRFTGYVSDEDLCALYSSCRACVYPSLYEGFGLPPLEAMACGAPVVTSRIASITETVGRAARLVEPTDVRALAQAIIDLLKSEAQQRHFSVAGIERAAQFTWEKTAQATLEVYDLALSNAAGKRRSFARRRRSGKMNPIHDHKVIIENLAHKINEGARRHGIDNGNRKNSTASSDVVELSDLEEARSSGESVPSQDVDRAPLTFQPAFLPHNGDHYHVSDLVQYDDRDFVQNSYRAILKRLPDPAGFDSYLDSLRKGNLDKVGVLIKLRFSPEGRAKHVRVKGLLLPALSRGARRLPVLGYLAQLGAGLAQLPAMVQRQRQLEARIVNQEREKRIADLRVEELSKSLDSAHAHVSETQARLSKAQAGVSEALRCLSEASETLTAQQRQINNLGTDSRNVRDEMRARVVELGERMSVLHKRSVALDETAHMPVSYDSHLSQVSTNEERRKIDAFYAEFTDAFRGARTDIK
ncbi:MAG: glycosyltransferase, partial [Acidobacteriota bacterium]|nr:glycosyltransferase [Acidobacteriota bacterium]